MKRYTLFLDFMYPTKWLKLHTAYLSSREYALAPGRSVYLKTILPPGAVIESSSYSYYTISFENENDAIAFKLQWQ